MAANSIDWGQQALSTGGDWLSQLAGPAISALLGNTGRMSDEHFKENENRADIDTERQVGRDNTYLAGVTPGRAAAYNQMQDSTYGEDIRRKTEGIKSMASDLKMSPWEITGTGSASSPVQPGPPSEGPSSQQFMAQAVPLQIAKMNNETAIAQTRMNNQTQLKLNDINTQQGKIPKQQLITEAARSVLTNAQSQREWQNITLDQARILMDAAPRERVNAPGYQRDSVAGNQQIRRLIGSLHAGDGESPLVDAVAALNINDPIENVIRGLKKMAQDVLDAGPGIAAEADKFLNNLGKPKR